MDQENLDVMNFTAVKITPPPAISKVTGSNVYAVVPSDWLFHAENCPNEQYVKYLFSSDHAEDNLLLKQLCETRAPPPDDWNLYQCTVIGKAEFMFEAAELIEKDKSLGKKNVAKGSKSVKNKVSANQLKKRALADKTNQLHAQFSAPIQNIFRNIAALPDEDQDSINLPDNAYLPQALENMPSDSTVSSVEFPDAHDKENKGTGEDGSKDEGIKTPLKDDLAIHNINGNDNMTRNDGDRQKLFDKLNEICKRLTALERSTRGLEKSLLDIGYDLNELKTFTMDQRRLKENANIISFAQLKSLHNLQLPLQTMDDFKEFEKKLVDKDNNLAKDLKTYILSTLNTTIKELEKNLRPIIRSFISQQIALSMTAQKQMANKTIFSSTNFSQLLKDCFVNAYADPSTAGPKKFDVAMGIVFNTKKQWAVQSQDVDKDEN